MAVKNFPTDILAQTKDVLTACQQIDPDMKTGALTQAAFADELSQTQAIQSQIQALELQLTGLRNKRDERLAGMWILSSACAPPSRAPTATTHPSTSWSAARA